MTGRFRSITTDGQFKRVLSNLIDNAVKYAYPRTEIRVDASVEGQIAVINIHNEGIELLSSDTERIFEYGYRATAAQDVYAPWTGIGLDVAREISDPPRGPMPPVHGPLPADAIREVTTVDAMVTAPDAVRGTHFAFVAFAGMTLLDLVGVHDAIARIGRMKLDETARFSFASATEDPWTEHGARFDAGFLRPDLGDVDVLVVPGGLGTRELVDDPDVIAWLRTHPPNRLKVSVCTGALLLGAAGFLEGRRATTHHSAVADLARFGAKHEDARVVHDRALVTGGGVTSAIDVGLHVVRLFHGDEAAKAVARQMEWR